jgi:hypothetical protein
MQELQRGEAHVSSMLSVCKQVKEIVRGRHTAPSALVTRTEMLINELEVTERKNEVVQRFKQDYQLDESAAQTITTGDIEEPFFKALERVHLVHENCRSLLHTHHQRAGLELLDSMASYEETAYERLCKCDNRWGNPMHALHAVLWVTSPRASLQMGAAAVPRAFRARNIRGASTARQCASGASGATSAAAILCGGGCNSAALLCLQGLSAGAHTGWAAGPPTANGDACPQPKVCPSSPVGLPACRI